MMKTLSTFGINLVWIVGLMNGGLFVGCGGPQSNDEGSQLMLQMSQTQEKKGEDLKGKTCANQEGCWLGTSVSCKFADCSKLCKGKTVSKELGSYYCKVKTKNIQISIFDPNPQFHPSHIAIGN